MRLNERGFVSFLGIIVTLAIIYFLFSTLIKSLNHSRTVPIVTQNGSLSMQPASLINENPQAIMQSAKEQVSAYNKIAADRMNSLLNITDH